MPLFSENRPRPANPTADLSIALLCTLPELHRSRRRSACAHQDLDIPSLPRLRAARRRFVGNFSEESEAGNIVVIVVITVFSAAAAAT